MEQQRKASVRQIMTQEREALVELIGLFERAQRVFAEYLPPDSGVSEEEALGRLAAILDGPEQRAAQAKVRQALGRRPAFFRAD